MGIDSSLKKMQVTIFPSKKDVPENVLLPKQVHGDEIVFVENSEENIDSCDGLITENKNLSLGVKTADCAPICFSDGNKIGVVHAGWRGLCLSLVEKMLGHFDKEEVEIFVGPHLYSFEIKKDDCYDKLSKKFGEKFFHTYNGKIIFNFRAAITSILPIEAKFDSRNTETELSLPSFRHRWNNDHLVTVVEFADK